MKSLEKSVYQISILRSLSFNQAEYKDPQGDD